MPRERPPARPRHLPHGRAARRLRCTSARRPLGCRPTPLCSSTTPTMTSRMTPASPCSSSPPAPTCSATPSARIASTSTASSNHFTWHIGLQRVVSAVTGCSWHVNRRSDAWGFIDSSRPPPRPVEQANRDHADLEPALLQTCRKRLTPSTRTPSTTASSSVAPTKHPLPPPACPLVSKSPPGIIDVLRQRRPEALALFLPSTPSSSTCIAAFDFWDLCQRGLLCFMIRSIAAHLGDYRSEWLAFPNFVLVGRRRAIGARTRAYVCASDNRREKTKRSVNWRKTPEFAVCNLLRPRHTRQTCRVLSSARHSKSPSNWARVVGMQGERERERERER
ncbi:hypothetical protein LY78DRAFT_390011 [Colletotrichum sublineola]|nr:hypothetical protein LY78DRAFT_390011 [Colletotrichum sublineola]